RLHLSWWNRYRHRQYCHVYPRSRTL
ncbi:uncharacterized protein METZ01_LOCUS226860, partial [marine metagenome]